MEVLLLTDIAGIGKKNDVIVVASGFALNHLLPEMKAIVVTPNVRKRYAEQIKARALERERERELQISVATTVAGKVVKVEANVGKAGKLYAAIGPAMVADALREQFNINVPASAIVVDDAIKTVGQHTVLLTIGTQKAKLTIDVVPEAKKVLATAA